MGGGRCFNALTPRLRAGDAAGGIGRGRDGKVPAPLSFVTYGAITY